MTRQVGLKEFVLHHMMFEEHTPLLIFPVLLHCKGVAVHFLLLSQGCMVEEQLPDAVHTEVGGGMGSLVGMTVASAHGRVGWPVVSFLLW